MLRNGVAAVATIEASEEGTFRVLLMMKAGARVRLKLSLYQGIDRYLRLIDSTRRPWSTLSEQENKNRVARVSAANK